MRNKIPNFRYIKLFTAMLAMGVASCNEKIPSSDAMKHVSEGRFGLKTNANVAVDAAGTAIWTKQILSGFEQYYDAKPASTKFVDEIKTCNFPKPDEGTSVKFIYSRHPNSNSSGVYAYNNASISKSAQDYVKKRVEQGQETRVDTYSREAKLEIIDVAITEASAPLHLVIGGAPAIYNFHLGPGVKIAAVAMLSGEGSGVANLPENVPVTGMRDGMISRCNAFAYRRPTPGWQLSNPANNSISTKEALVRLNRLQMQFSNFFHANFGVHSESVVIGGESFHQMLIGPPPADLKSRIPFKSIENGTVQFVRPDNMVVGSKEDFKDKYRAAVTKAAEGMVTGGLQSLNRAK